MKSVKTREVYKPFRFKSNCLGIRLRNWDFIDCLSFSRSLISIALRWSDDFCGENPRLILTYRRTGRTADDVKHRIRASVQVRLNTKYHPQLDNELVKPIEIGAN